MKQERRPFLLEGMQNPLSHSLHIKGVSSSRKSRYVVYSPKVFVGLNSIVVVNLSFKILGDGKSEP